MNQKPSLEHGSPRRLSRQEPGSHSCTQVEGQIINSEVASGVGDRFKEGFREGCSLDTSDEYQGIWKEGPWEKGVYQRKVRARILSPPCLPTETRVSAPGS